MHEEITRKPKLKMKHAENILAKKDESDNVEC